MPDVAGQVHRYVPSSPGCWRTFGQVQADEAERFGYLPANRLVVDAYMAQHPGDGRDRRDRQSVFIHLVGLCAAVERGWPRQYPVWLLGEVIRRHHGQFPILERADGPGALTVLHMVGAADHADYERRALEWARAVWAGWRVHHELVRAELRAVLRRE